MARTVTRPLARITDHMRQVAATGDLTRKLQLSDSRGWHDEDTQLLATTFNTLTDSIARFQREAAQRERLSSLGRMSTVIAHEVRNPLMIIKGALRQLARDGATAADVRDAAADIDGEIDRLNRLVNEVLDFARPIRFDRAPTDINALCRDAVCAVAAAAAESGPPVTTELDPSVPTLDTDGERLRTVLVNLLTNARQAVLARTSPAPAAGSAPVTLATGAADRSARRHLDPRPRQRHRRRGSAAHLRSILHDAARRHRPRPADRQEHHRRPRRLDHRREHARRRHEHPHRAGRRPQVRA